MALVVLLRGVNVGGHRTFRPSTLAEQLKHLDAVNIGAAGTFVIRRPVTRVQLRAELARRLPFDAHVMICEGRDIVRLMSHNHFANQPVRPDIVRFVSVLSQRPRSAPSMPLVFPSSGKWLLKILARDDRFVFGVYRRHMKVISYLGTFDRIFGVPATTRNWNTITAISRIIRDMRRGALVLAGHLVFAACSTVASTHQPDASAKVVLFEGARLITGGAGPPIERSAFTVENNRFSRIGRKGELQAPPGAARVDLTGKTVIPALVDAHSHIGYMKDLTSGPQNYTRENILDHMYRFAYFGVAASQAMGSDFGELPYQLRDEFLAGRYPDAARFLTAGRGLAPIAEIRPDNMRHAAYAVTTIEGARAAVQELALRNVKIVKTWVDDRGGTIAKLTPALYRAIIDEAHRQNMRVAVHATGLEDAKDLLRAGVDVFAHMIGDVDAELVALFKQHPHTAVLSALGAPRRTIYAPWIDPPHPLVAETVSPAQIKRLQARLAAPNAGELERGRQTWARLTRGLARLNAAGVTIAAATDGGGQTGDQFVGWTMHTEMENLVAAGMTPSQALVAATRTSAQILGLDELGMVAPGKSADFVVLDVNPLDDITNTRRINSVYLRGRQIDRERLRSHWTAARKDSQ